MAYNFNKILRYLIKIIVSVAIITGLYFFCESQTRGFRPYLIVSNLPNDERWELSPLAPEEQVNIHTLLSQEFTFLGSGGWCFAFLGQDGTTVLKFYKHSHLLLPEILRNFTFKKLLMKSPPWKEGDPYFQEFNFISCKLMYEKAKEQVGILYAHLNKTTNLHPPVTLIDNLGIRHTIDLDKTEFIVQKKAELVLFHLQKCVDNHQIEKAKQSIDQLFECLLSLSQKGIRDYDRSIRKNYGFIEDRAIAFDISSFGIDESLKHPDTYKKELRLKMHRVERWLRKHQPELYSYYQRRINEI